MTLDQIAQNPSAALGLPAATLASLQTQCAAVLVGLGAAMPAMDLNPCTKVRA